MNHLSLFTGAGGGELAANLLGWVTLGYVEFNKYCQKVLEQRIKDGMLDKAPIFSDVREFADIAQHYAGFIDVVSGGFPCQPFSTAGKREGESDERNMWPATIDIVKKIQPRFCFFENVRGLLSASVDDESGRPFFYFGEILRDLEKAGYDAKWCLLGADDLGLCHRRKRVWIFAYRNDTASKRQRKNRMAILSEPESRNATERVNGYAANSKGKQGDGAECESAEHQKQSVSESGNSGQQCDAADSECARAPSQAEPRQPVKTIGGVAGLEQAGGSGACKANADNARCERRTWREQEAVCRIGRVQGCEDIRVLADYFERPGIPKPLLRGMDDGVAHRVDRSRAVGNGQVPAVAAAAFRLLSQGIIEWET